MFTVDSKRKEHQTGLQETLHALQMKAVIVYGVKSLTVEPSLQKIQAGSLITETGE